MTSTIPLIDAAISDNHQRKRSALEAFCLAIVAECERTRDSLLDARLVLMATRDRHH